MFCDESTYEAKDRIEFIENLKDDNFEHWKKIESSIIWIFHYLFNVGHSDINYFKEDEDIKKLPAIIEEKFKYFDDSIRNYRNSRLYYVLQVRSAIHFLIDSFCENNEKLRDKLKKLDSYLIEKSDDLPNVLEDYYEMRNDSDDSYEFIGHEYWSYVERILETRNLPKSHDWWPDCCRKDN